MARGSNGGSGAKVNFRSGGSIRGGGRAFSGCGSSFAHEGSPGAFVTAAASGVCGLLKSALLRSILCNRLLGLGRVAVGFLFRVFVVVGVVSPMLHGPSCARKPVARAAVERARGTTTGSPCRVTLSGAFFALEMLLLCSFLLIPLLLFLRPRFAPDEIECDLVVRVADRWNRYH